MARGNGRVAVVLLVAGAALASGGGGGTPAAATSASSSSSSAGGGTLGCSGLESLWDSAGGDPGEAQMAASIAMAESGGQQDAQSPAGDVGYWQINAPIWGGLATTDPAGNAKAAIQISHNGTDWSPWVTYKTSAYQGKC